MKKFFIIAFKIIIVIFAIAGFGLLSAYIAVYMHWTDTKGIVDNQADTFWKDSKATVSISEAPILENANANDAFFNKKNYCLLRAVKDEYPGYFTRILNLALNNEKELAQKNLDTLLTVLDINLDPILSADISSCNSDNNNNISELDFKILADMVDSKSPFVWANSDEWNFFKTGVLKDIDVLNKVEAETGINKRILVSELMAEQMRLFYSDRTWFKQAVEPLKVLGSMTQFSWGIFGLKEDTAEHIEVNLKNTKSAFYLGPEFENMLDFKTQNITQERFNRITDNSNHYYAYLYATLYDKEIISQWKKSGIDISNRPEILATLYNIGFAHSSPNPNPQVGGAELQIGDSTYSFGRLSSEFYYSGELLDEFPQFSANVTEAPSENSTPFTNDTVASISSAISSQWPNLLNYLIPLFK
jgi:hypothetical protein